MAESHREEIAKLEALYAANPGGRVFVHLAEAYRKAGEHERARRILDEGLARHPDSASGFVVLGRVLADMQVTAEAEVAFHRVLELDAGNLIALRWLGDLARQTGRNAEAAIHYRELLVRNPSNEEVRDLVEIVERDAGPLSTAEAVGGAADDEEADTDAFAALDTEAAHDEPALAGSAGEAEEAALMSPSPASDTEPPDVTPWAAAPGGTGDAEEPPVEFGLIELDTSEEEQEAASDRPRTVDAPAGPGEESDVVSSTDDEDVLELDELRRDDEAEPLEIHLLDPAFEPAGEEGDDFASELDLSDLAAAAVEDEEDYADDIFVADLAAATGEEAEPDALPGGVDVMEAGSALTLLPQDEAASEEDATPSERETARWDTPPVEPDLTTAVQDVSPAERDFATAGQDDSPSEADLSMAGHDSTSSESDLGVAPHDGTPAAIDVMHAQDPTGAATQAEEAAREDAAAPTPTFEEAGDVEPDEPGAVAEEEELSEAGLTSLAGAAEPAHEGNRVEPSGPVKEVRRSADSGLVTETMAVLYRSQGFHDRAADVYRALLRARPDDERLAARLRDAEEAAGTAARPSADDDAGEVWLRGVGAAWTAPGDDSTADATPYAWTDEPEDGDAGEPIGSYLHDLISWKTGSGGWQQPGTDQETQQVGEIEIPEWMNGPASAERESPAQPAEPAAEADWSPAQPAESDPWAVTPGSGGTDAAPPEASADPWTVPGEAQASQSADSDAEGGWTPLELERDVPPAAAAPDVARPAAAQSAQPEEDSSDDDDDLEMFRSWLQSLKK